MLQPFWISTLNTCAIGISPHPTGGEVLASELKGIVEGDQVALVSLLTEEEISYLKLQEEASICETLGIQFLAFPIPDMSIPGAMRYVAFIDELSALSHHMDRLLIHCRAGIGRSSLVALGLMCKAGIPLKSAIQQASRIRGMEVPQSASQRKLLAFYENHLTKP